ncbi:RhuM family protein [Methylotuvimicrobium sp. KM1]|uniref:RhuM family protein n=1 Tax=Methylotuvimicrobium sp. KM1 TaxID=3377707 RepID=UPI00384D365E
MTLTNAPQQIAIYQNEDGSIRIDVHLEQETVWLNQAQMVELFGRDQSVISRHIANAFKDEEVSEKSNMQKMHIANSDKPVAYYDLDVIISVGYRIKSKRGVQFRRWATQILKQYLLQGYALNEQKLRASQEKLADLQRAIALSSRLVHNKSLSANESQGILTILEQYSHALTVLDDYDHQRLVIAGTQKATQTPIRYAEAIAQIRLWRQQEGLGQLFGNEKDDSFKSSLSTIYQTFGGEELYPSIEEKAANLLYFIVKNHSFSDGNKRIAAAIFAWFLQRHDYLYNQDGEKRIADNALVAFTLLIAESKPEEKDTIVKVIINLINGKNG